MKSMVVLFSVMALVAAKPSGLLQPGIISYAAPAIALAPAAVSHQSRLDIKSSPAIISEKIIAPVAEPAIVAAPAAYAAPGVIAGPVAYSAPAAYFSPAVYSAPVAVAPAAVSSQSRLDIKSSPAIISTVAAGPVLSAYSAPFAAAYFAPAIAPAAALLKSEIKPIAVTSSEDVAAAVNPELPVAPTETPEVAAARAAHLEAKALEESHQINKRSLRYVASAPVVSTYSALPLPLVPSPVYSSPIAVSNPLIGHAYRFHY